MKTLLLACLLASMLTDQAMAMSLMASWYNQGTKTANGEHFYPLGHTCASLTLPFDTVLKLTYRGHSTTCRVNDHGPYVKGRDIDLSEGTARSLHFAGVHEVQAEVLAR